MFALVVLSDISFFSTAFILLAVLFFAVFLCAGVASILAATGAAVVESAHAVSVIHGKVQRQLFMKERPKKRLLAPAVAAELASRDAQKPQKGRSPT